MPIAEQIEYQEPTNPQTIVPSKLPYQSPKLVRYGDLAALTQNGPVDPSFEFGEGRTRVS